MVTTATASFSSTRVAFNVKDSYAGSDMVYENAGDGGECQRSSYSYRRE